jgi:hypothetical protein
MPRTPAVQHHSDAADGDEGEEGVQHDEDGIEIEEGVGGNDVGEEGEEGHGRDDGGEGGEEGAVEGGEDGGEGRGLRDAGRADALNELASVLRGLEESMASPTPLTSYKDYYRKCRGG